MNEPKKHGIHEDKPELFCNRCKKYIKKHSETLVIPGPDGDNVHCIYCWNWLCGFFDAFGHTFRPGDGIREEEFKL